MADIRISQEDLTDAENFLVAFLTEQVPDASFKKGTAMRDLAVKAFTYLFAYLRGEIDLVGDRQSLYRISEAADLDADDITQAADEILSNWFLSRKTGTAARTTARFHFLQKTALSIALDTKFWRTNETAFYIDALVDPYTIPASTLLPVYNSSGVLVDYVVDIPLVASAVGESYNIEAGQFVGYDSENGIPYFSYAENLYDIKTGKNVETTTDLIDRAQTAITVRNLINNRSCDTVLQEEFPAITETLTIGMGEVEMVRDRKYEIAPHIDIHTGGFFDTYVEMPYTDAEESGTIGGYFPRPDSKAVVFRDPWLTNDDHTADGYPGGRKFTDAPAVSVGDVIYIREGISGAPLGYTVTEVRPTELLISAGVPFSEAYDEKTVDWSVPLNPDPGLIYSIGHIAPSFDDIPLLPGDYVRTALQSTSDPTIPVGTSRHIQEPGVIVLAGVPIQDVTWVEITSPLASDGAIINPSTGTIVFNNRVNSDPVGPMLEPSLTQYRVQVLNPTSGQSADTVTLIQVGYIDPSVSPAVSYLDHFDGQNLRVVYKTLSDFTNVADYVTNRDRRISAANQLVRARNPIWLEMTIPYRMKPTSGDTLDHSAAAEFLATYINNFDPNDDLDFSDLATQLRNEYAGIGVVFPFTIYYHLHSPDGQIASYSTEDVVSIFDLNSNGATLLNGNSIVAPQVLSSLTFINTPGALVSWYGYLGITDRTVNYRAKSSNISFYIKG